MRVLSLHLPATFTLLLRQAALRLRPLWRTYQAEPGLICSFCTSDRRFAYSFFQIFPRREHPCCSAMCFLVTQVHSGLSPVRMRPWRAYHKCAALYQSSTSLFSHMYAEIHFHYNTIFSVTIYYSI